MDEECRGATENGWWCGEAVVDDGQASMTGPEWGGNVCVCVCVCSV